MPSRYTPHPDPARRRLREPGLERLSIELRISAEVLGAFRDGVRERGMSQSDALREAIEQWVLRQAQR